MTRHIWSELWQFVNLMDEDIDENVVGHLMISMINRKWLRVSPQFVS